MKSMMMDDLIFMFAIGFAFWALVCIIIITPIAIRTTIEMIREWKEEDKV